MDIEVLARVEALMLRVEAVIAHFVDGEISDRSFVAQPSSAFTSATGKGARSGERGTRPADTAMSSAARQRGRKCGRNGETPERKVLQRILLLWSCIIDVLLLMDFAGELSAAMGWGK